MQTGQDFSTLLQMTADDYLSALTNVFNCLKLYCEPWFG